MQIDEKLKEIVWGASSISAGMDDFGALEKSEQEQQVDETVAQIKQVFADEGYIKIPQIREIKGKTETQHNLVDINNMGYMTGQDWYERFEKELNMTNALYGKDGERALKIAEKASGL